MRKCPSRSKRNARVMGSRHSNLHIGLCIALLLAAPAARAAGASADTPVQMADSTSDLDDWNAIKTSKSADHYRNYPPKHPDGAFADLAKLRIKHLLGRGSQASAREKRAASCNTTSASAAGAVVAVATSRRTCAMIPRNGAPR